MGESRRDPVYRIRVLGDVAVDGPAGTTPSRSPRLRTALAVLAASAGTPVGNEVLIDELWGTALPKKPSGALQVLMTRLRAWLGGHAGVRTTGGGYVLDLGDDDPVAVIDLLAFHAAAARALESDAPPATVLEATTVALMHHAGEPLPGCVPGGRRLEAERVRVTERFLRVLEARAEALLRTGEAEEAADLLLPHLDRHRDRVRLTLLAMRALAAQSRVAEALGVLGATRRHLRVEYGADPSPELLALERELLAAPRPRTAGRTRGFVGRTRPLAAVRERLDASGGGGIVVLHGEAGIGKTSLLGAVRDEAAARGAHVSGGTFDADGSPLGGWSEALAPLGALPRPGAGPLGPALRARLAEIADDAPVVLTLDDVHRADSASLGALRALARLRPPAGVVVLVAAREPDAVAHPLWADTHADLARLDGVLELRLDELDEADARDLVDRRLTAPDPDGEIADVLWRRAGGHPLHLDSLLDVVADLPDVEACLAAAATVPERLRPLLDHQVAQMPPDCRDVLAALAVLHPVPADALARVLETSVLTMTARLRPAVALGLLSSEDDRVAFRHELLARAVLDRVPAAERALLHHRRFLDLVDGADGADPFDRLRHAVGAGTLLDAVVVADVRVDAAWAAYRRGAHDEALALLDVAGAASRPQRVALHRGLVLEALGQGEEADTVLDGVVAAVVGTPVGPGAGPGGAAGADGIAGAVEDAVDAAVGDDALGISVAGRPRRLERLRRVRDLDLSVHQRVRVLRALIVEEEQLLGDVADDDALPELLALAGDPGMGTSDPRLLAQVRLMEANRLADAALPAADRLAVCGEALALAVATGDAVLRLEGEELLVAALLAAGRVDEALARHAALEPEARRRRRPRSIWAVDMVRTTVLLARGDVEEADAAAQATMERGQELGILDAMGAFGVHLFARHWLGGTLPTLGGLPAGAAAMYPHVAAWAAAAAVDAAQAGDLGTASAHLVEFHRRREGRPGRMFDRPGLAVAAAAAFVLGDAATARAVLAGFPPDPGAVVVVGVGAAVFGPVALHQAFARHALGERAEAARLARVAVALADGVGWTPWADVGRALVACCEGDADARPFGLAPPA